MLPVAVVGNVDPQMPPERFSCQCARELDEKSSLPLQMESGGRNLAGIREEFASLADSKKFFYINDLWWLCWQSSANVSLGSNSLIRGKIQGILPVLAAKARKFGFPKISQLLTTKFPTHQNREFCRANRELFPAEQGRALAKSPADGIFGKDTARQDPKRH